MQTLDVRRLGGVVVRTLDLWLSLRWFESRSWHCLVVSEIGDRILQVNYLGILPPLRSTQPCIPQGSLNWVPASAGIKAGKSLRHCVIPHVMWFPVAMRWFQLRTAISLAFTFLIFIRKWAKMCVQFVIYRLVYDNGQYEFQHTTTLYCEEVSTCLMLFVCHRS